MEFICNRDRKKDIDFVTKKNCINHISGEG